MAAVVWVRDALGSRTQAVCLHSEALVRDLLPQGDSGLPLCDIYVKCNGHLACPEEKLRNGFTYSLESRLCGGKGGFGSMLRALGAQIEKTTNREACRDLSGRRLRDVNHEKAMAEWTKKQAEREAEKEQRRLERLKRKLEEPKHYFTDPEYHQQCHDMSERLEDSVIKGLQASSSSAVSPESSDTWKRKKTLETSKEKSGKNNCFWTGLEGLEAPSSSDDSDPDESSCSSTSSKYNEDFNQRLHSPESQNSSDGSLQEGSDRLEQNQQHETSLTEPDTAKQAERCSNEGSEQNSEPTNRSNELDHAIEASPVQTEIDCQTVNAEPKNQTNKNAIPNQPDAQLEHPQQTNTNSTPIDLSTYKTAAGLEALGLERLKTELVALGLKCGGTLHERAARLFSVQGLSKSQINPALFAKPAKGKKK
ncbi:hypothetical protein GDO86_009138 [Hymenochirus boettgeri]|uniref:Replication stress response regulator SDE2 n=1 Tax=Hymenochirus boettgeri TaxID=247094 RepID=A0A8T2JET2_9PIPI|nr:hypothetical protein GDO86_009138 [Hymenochirus boettgeri]